MTYFLDLIKFQELKMLSFKIEVNDDDISKDSATDPLQFLSSDIDKEENLDDEHKDSNTREEKIVEINYSNDIFLIWAI